MASLDWSQCPAVEGVTGVARCRVGIREPRSGADIEEIVEQFHVASEQIQAVLEFTAGSPDARSAPARGNSLADANFL